MYRPFIHYCILAAATGLLSACSKTETTATADAAEELPRVEAGVAEARDVPQQKEYTANVEAYNVNNISPAAPNRIKTITVEVGDRVRRGQTLVTLDRASLDQIKINLEQIEREYNRANTLLEIGAGTQQAVDQLKAQLDAARTQYKNAAENAVLVSPVDGVVTARNYDPGDMTGSLPLLTVGQLSPVVKIIINA
ncbi:MAG: efflux RND transporter periplasmic adaptor subunit, partial [Muribaculaceae bacterium]|nr:efflux RND transporter periplasmic adaptor subunit [Muribaculaceae bacterium]